MNLRRSKKEDFLAAFQKLYDCVKACIYANGAYFEWKKKLCLLHVSSIFKKIHPKTFGPHCVGTYLVSTGITNGWSTRLGMPLLCHCFLHFLPTASTLACLLPFFWPSQLQYPKLPLIWVAGHYKPLTRVTPLPSSLARTSLISCTVISRVVLGVTQSPILMVNIKDKKMWSCQCLWVSRSVYS
jgi:hypothetical protein